MPSPYQVFAEKARERFLERQKKKASGVGTYQFTLHAQYKMKQYGLSAQKVRSVIRNPKRREEGIVPKTVAVMQPVSPKKVGGREVWKQEIWVLFQIKNQNSKIKNETEDEMPLEFPIRYTLKAKSFKIISAWRYPGISPKRNPIPDEILEELRAIAPD
ncbi:MAG TPA: hypothetical protein VJ521_06835 [Acidobacteriota bacterium]|nr:hypothetical protein [Acidobacteriota bacterium]